MITSDDEIFDLEVSNAAPDYDNISALKPSMPWLDELNPEQRQAVETTEGPLLVLSGAGTGKTKVLTTRLAYILTQMKAQPWNCLVVTFTNRAAKEMKERVQNLIGDMVNNVWLGTFHGICVKILRQHAELVGLHSNFTILSEDDQKRLIKQIMETEGIDDKKYPPQSIVEKISRLKDKGLTVEKINLEYKSTVLSNIYSKYQKRLLELNCVDFGDILLHTLIILMSNNEILQKYQDKFKYVMVDEYQDTNVTQYLFLRLISQKYRNLCCVGDDDQSIYSWRGAEIENIMRFQKDFDDAKIIRLEQNYRSTVNILNAASNLISHNKTRLGKTLRVAENSIARNKNNEKIKLVSIYSGEEEAKWIVSEIKKLHQSGYEYKNIAVLVRTAFQTREFEEKFINEAIPYQVIGGPKFYERAEIRDILAYFRVIVQPDDDLALERIINKPARGIGSKTIEKLEQIAHDSNTSLFEAVKIAINQDILTGKSKNSLMALVQNFHEWQKSVNTTPLDDLASKILEDTGYWDMLKNDSSAEASGRIENLKELINVISDTNTYPNLAEFLDHVSLVMENDNVIDYNKVMLITLHSAKGLEFDVVFLPGWEDGLFPHQKSLDEGGENSLEEERRLAYVAITRAKQKLYITTTFNRRIYGQWQNNIPSRFLNEIPSECLQINNQTSNCYANNTYNKKSSFYNKSTYRNYDKSSYYKDNTSHQYTYETYDDDNFEYSPNKLIGVKVYHEVLGYGVITKTDGNFCEVNFENYGRRKVLGTYLRRA